MSARRDLSAEHPRRSSCLPAAPFAGTEAIMLAHGFTGDLIEYLLHEGFATTRPGTTRAGKRQVRVVWVAITDAGRRTLAG